MTSNSILFDIGATKTRVAFSDNLIKFEEPTIFQTKRDYEEWLGEFLRVVKDLSKDRSIFKMVGGMSRNIFEGDYGRLKKDLEASSLGEVEVLVENDSAMVGLGEAVFGAGRGFEIVAYMTVSTGVGGARIVAGKVDKKSVGFEPGKQIVDIEEGLNKTLEDLISGRALGERTGQNPKEINDPKVWDDLAQKLAVGLNNIIVEWSPEVVVLGGSMITGDPAIPLDKAEGYLKEILKIFGELPVIKKAELGDFGGLWGALKMLEY